MIQSPSVSSHQGTLYVLNSISMILTYTQCWRSQKKLDIKKRASLLIFSVKNEANGCNIDTCSQCYKFFFFLTDIARK
jgi:hypothetical protein